MNEEPSTSDGSTRSISKKRQDEVDVMASKPPKFSDGTKLPIPQKLQDKNYVISDKHSVVTGSFLFSKHTRFIHILRTYYIV